MPLLLCSSDKIPIVSHKRSKIQNYRIVLMNLWPNSEGWHRLHRFRQSSAGTNNHTTTLKQTWTSDSITLKEECCHLWPWRSSALNSCQVPSYTLTLKSPHAGLSQGQTGSPRRSTCCHTHRRADLLSLPPHYCLWQLTHRKPAAAISVPPC